MTNMFYLVHVGDPNCYGVEYFYSQDIYLVHEFFIQYYYANCTYIPYEAANVVDFTKQVYKEKEILIDPLQDKLRKFISWDEKYSIITSYSYIEDMDLYLQGMEMLQALISAWYNLNILKDYTKDGYKTELKNFLSLLTKYVVRIILFDRVDFESIKPEYKEALGFNEDYFPSEIIDDYTILAMVEKGV